MKKQRLQKPSPRLLEKTVTSPATVCEECGKNPATVRFSSSSGHPTGADSYRLTVTAIVNLCAKCEKLYVQGKRKPKGVSTDFSVSINSVTGKTAVKKLKRT